jgi:hypothetical protein
MSTIDWQARALAAEVALIGIRKYLDNHADIEDRPDGGEGRPNFAMCALVAMDATTPDLAAARELVRKAGEYDKALAIFENENKPTPGNLMDYLAPMAQEFMNCPYLDFKCGTFGSERGIEHKPAAGPTYFTTVNHWRALVKENAALSHLVTELRGALEDALESLGDLNPHHLYASIEDAMALPQPEAVKKAAAERDFCDAALAFAEAKATINDQADRYETALAALQAARRDA